MLEIELGDKAQALLEEFGKTTGLGDPSRVIEEALFTVHEILEAIKETKSKTEPTLPADRFIGIVSSFTRYKGAYDY